MNDDVLASVASELLQDNAKVLAASKFLQDAQATGMWHSQMVYGPSQSLTIFVPHNQHYRGSARCFEEFWYRHAVNGKVHVKNEGVQQMTSLAKLVYALYRMDDVDPSDINSGFAIASVPITEFWSIEYNGNIFHGIDAAELPDIRPIPGDTSKLRTCYIGGETIDIRFLSTGLNPLVELTNYTMIVSITQPDRTPLTANQKIPWYGNGTNVKIVIPYVTTTQNAMLWLSLFDNRYRHSIVCTTVLWLLVIEPNVNMHANVFISDINPVVGKAEDKLWIKGRGFCTNTVRVVVGNQSASVYSCESTLIQCIVPTGLEKKNVVWVANGNVYTRSPSLFTYSD